MKTVSGENAVPEHRTESFKEFRTDSLVGSYFHGSNEERYQGVVVAEPSPGIYLVELFDWITGFDSNEQILVRIKDMLEWHFYDTSEWMNNAYRNGVNGWKKDD